MFAINACTFQCLRSNIILIVREKLIDYSSLLLIFVRISRNGRFKLASCNFLHNAVIISMTTSRTCINDEYAFNNNVG